ncbi:MAG TPA: hypothetical protein VK905_02165 [Bacillota bacterium]|jgi:hypothetical protein|nr:hypothetical protein [Bacillota bacterium]
MVPLGESMLEYNRQLRAGEIRRAYRGLMHFMAGLRAYFEQRYPGHYTGAIYPGYMDMTYFSFTPEDIKERKLKIAVVYLHEEGRFEAWLTGGNRRIQAAYIDALSTEELGRYRLSSVSPGVDSIIETILVEAPDFDDPDGMIRKIEKGVRQFTEDMANLLTAVGNNDLAKR